MSEETVAVPAVEMGAAPAAQPDPAGLFALATVPPPFLTQDYFLAALQDYENDKALQVGDIREWSTFESLVGASWRTIRGQHSPFIVGLSINSAALLSTTTMFDNPPVDYVLRDWTCNQAGGQLRQRRLPGHRVL